MKISKLILEEIITPDNCLGITRDQMPQINGKDIPEFTSWIRLEKGVGVESREMRVKDLKPSQSELDTDKADKIWAEGNAREYPIFVSEDGYVLDGHHRWLAVCRHDDLGSIRCQVISKPAKEALELMHDFEKSHKVDIEDNKVVEKLAKVVKNLCEDSEADYADNMEERIWELGFEDIEVEEVSVDHEDKIAHVLFTDGESDLLAAFWVDEELGPVATVIDEESEEDSDEVDVIQLNAPVVDGMIDFDNGVSWLTEEDIETLLTWGDEDTEEIEERSITVIRGGKKVRKKVIRKRRKKRLTAKRKASIRKAVRKKKAKKAQIQRKRKRSLNVRKRAKLKRKPKNLRVVG